MVKIHSNDKGVYMERERVLIISMLVFDLSSKIVHRCLKKEILHGLKLIVNYAWAHFWCASIFL